jgi:hypothetical protein
MAVLTRQILDKLLDTLPEERLQQLLDYAQFLSLKEEQQEWTQAGLASLARAYEAEEQGYTEDGSPAETK